MRRLNGVLTALVVVGLAAAPASAGEEREFKESWPAGELTVVRFEMSVGEVQVTGADVDSVEVEVRGECRWSRRERECEEALEELELFSKQRGDVLRVELDGYPKWGRGRLEVDVFVTVPSSLEFDLDMGVGEVEISGIENDLDVDLGVGEVEIASSSAHLRSVNVDVGVGDAEILGDASRVRGKRSFLVGSEAYWAEGEGDSRIRVDVGVGDIAVRLD